MSGRAHPDQIQTFRYLYETVNRDIKERVTLPGGKDNGTLYLMLIQTYHHLMERTAVQRDLCHSGAP